MADVDAVINMVARLALSETDLGTFDATAAQLLILESGKSTSRKELERGVPWRFLNVPSGASLALVTGLERVLGAHDACAEAGGMTVPHTAVEHPTTTAKQTAVEHPTTTAKQTAVERPTTTAQPTGPMVSVEDMYLFCSHDVESHAAWDDGEVDYDVTEGDAMLMQAGLMKKSKTLTSATLMTKKMRDEERRRKLESLQKARIRLELGRAFEDLVVQFEVPAEATLKDVHDVVQFKLLKSPTTFFRLVDLMPPRKEIARTAESVYESGMWPASRLTMELEPGVTEDVFAEPLLRRKGMLPPQKSCLGLAPTSRTSAPGGDAPASSQAGRVTSAPSKPASVPKWFKK